MSLGNAKGGFHSSASLSGLRETKAGIRRILKKGKEQAKSEISEKIGSMIVSVKVFQAQVYNTVEGADPATHFRIRGSEDQMTVKGGTAGLVRGGLEASGKVPSTVLPGVSCVKYDTSEPVCPCSQDL